MFLINSVLSIASQLSWQHEKSCRESQGWLTCLSFLLRGTISHLPLTYIFDKLAIHYVDNPKRLVVMRWQFCSWEILLSKVSDLYSHTAQPRSFEHYPLTLAALAGHCAEFPICSTGAPFSIQWLGDKDFPGYPFFYTLENGKYSMLNKT